MTQTHKKKKNPLGLWLGGALIVFGLLAVVNGVTSLTDNKTRLIAPSGIITVEKVETPEDKRQGLSGRESIGNDEGMLFVFTEASTSNCLVMRDMLISIDMIWLNQDKEVVTLKENAVPESYPDEVYCPSEPAKYALEIGSGRSESLGIAPGELLRF